MNKKCTRCGRTGDEINGSYINEYWYGPVCFQKAIIYGEGEKNSR